MRRILALLQQSASATPSIPAASAQSQSTSPYIVDVTDFQHRLYPHIPIHIPTTVAVVETGQEGDVLTSPPALLHHTYPPLPPTVAVANTSGRNPSQYHCDENDMEEEGEVVEELGCESNSLLPPVSEKEYNIKSNAKDNMVYTALTNCVQEIESLLAQREGRGGGQGKEEGEEQASERVCAYLTCIREVFYEGQV